MTRHAFWFSLQPLLSRAAELVIMDVATHVGMVDAHQMTAAQLRDFGMPTLVYLRAGLLDGAVAYAIHAADGTRMAVVEDIDCAIEIANERGMLFVAVH